MSSISIYLDTNCINSLGQIQALNELEKLNDEEKIIIEKSGVLDLELLQNPQKNIKRLKKSDNYIESYDIGVLGHSRIEHSIVASDQDDETFTLILEILWGKKARDLYSKNEIRDALHIHTASRYGGTYFVTYEKALLNKSDLIKVNFSIIITSPEDCLVRVKQRLKILEEAKKWREKSF